MPYPQLLFSEETVQRFVDEDREELVDSYDAKSDKTRIGPYLNKLPLNEYRDPSGTRQRQFTQLWHVERTSCAGLVTMVQHAVLFRARAPSFKDLVVAGIKFAVIKG